MFGEETDSPRTETLAEYTKRRGLLRNTYHVPVIALFTSMLGISEEVEKGKLPTGRQFAGIFLVHNLLILGASHMACYMLGRKENVRRS